jgi:hypothetical protein
MEKCSIENEEKNWDYKDLIMEIKDIILLPYVQKEEYIIFEK